MPLTQKSTYTTDDIYALPEGQRAELINGVIYEMAPPNRIHQEIVMNFSAAIHDYIKITMVTAKSILLHSPFFECG